jgi:hypothetical protein
MVTNAPGHNEWSDNTNPTSWVINRDLAAALTDNNIVAWLLEAQSVDKADELIAIIEKQKGENYDTWKMAAIYNLLYQLSINPQERKSDKDQEKVRTYNTYFELAINSLISGSGRESYKHIRASLNKTPVQICEEFAISSNITNIDILLNGELEDYINRNKVELWAAEFYIEQLESDITEIFVNMFSQISAQNPGMDYDWERDYYKSISMISTEYMFHSHYEKDDIKISKFKTIEDYNIIIEAAKAVLEDDNYSFDFSEIDNDAQAKARLENLFKEAHNAVKAGCGKDEVIAIIKKWLTDIMETA